MILASGEGQLIFLVVMAVLGLINWIANRANAGDKKTPPPDPSRPGAESASPRRANPESEEERIRRFLEALGLPGDTPPAPPRPAPKPRPDVRPVPPIVYQPKAPRPQKRPAVPPPLVPAARRARSLEELSEPSGLAEQIAVPELLAPSIREFETLSSRVSALPADFSAAQDEAGRAAAPTMAETLRAALASPRQLRSAFILSEIFGTPPGLRQP